MLAKTTGAPVDQAGRLYASEAERWVNRFEQDRDEDPSALARVRFLDHPVRYDGMARPSDDDASGVGESFADVTVPAWPGGTSRSQKTENARRSSAVASSRARSSS